MLSLKQKGAETRGRRRRTSTAPRPLHDLTRPLLLPLARRQPGGHGHGSGCGFRSSREQATKPRKSMHPRSDFRRAPPVLRFLARAQSYIQPKPVTAFSSLNLPGAPRVTSDLQNLLSARAGSHGYVTQPGQRLRDAAHATGRVPHATTHKRLQGTRSVPPADPPPLFCLQELEGLLARGRRADLMPAEPTAQSAPRLEQLPTPKEILLDRGPVVPAVGHPTPTVAHGEIRHASLLRHSMKAC